MNSFEKKVLQYAKLHPDDTLSKYFLESYAASEQIRKEEAKRWKLIALGLEYYQYRTTRASIKSNQEVE